MLVTLFTLLFLNVNKPINLICFGDKHPYFKDDGYFFGRISDSYTCNSKFFNSSAIFTSADELFKILSKATVQFKEINHLLLMSHSDMNGLFVEHAAGLYRDAFFYKKQKMKFKNIAKSVQDLKYMVQNGNIKFSKKSIVMIGGCFTYIPNDTSCFAYNLARAVNKPVVCSNNKIAFIEEGGEILIKPDPKGDIYLLQPLNGKIMQTMLTNQTISVDKCMDKVDKLVNKSKFLFFYY